MPSNTDDKAKKSKSELDINLNQLSLTMYQYFWIVIALVCVLVLVLAYQFFLKPKYDSIVSNQEIITKQQQYIDQSQYYNQLVALRNTYEKISPEDKEKINQIVSTVNNQNELYREVEYIIKKNGLTVDGIEPVTLDKAYALPNIAQNTQPSPLLSNMKMTMTSCSMSNVNYDALIRVLRTFEVNLRLMDVVKVEYDPASKKASAQFITYQF